MPILSLARPSISSIELIFLNPISLHLRLTFRIHRIKINNIKTLSLKFVSQTLELISLKFNKLESVSDN